MLATDQIESIVFSGINAATFLGFTSVPVNAQGRDAIHNQSASTCRSHIWGPRSPATAALS
jgi:hypothetical protein